MAQIASKPKSVGVQFLMDHPERYGDIPGNAPDDVKKTITDMMKLIVGHSKGFGDHIGYRLHITSMDMGSKAAEPAKLEARVVTELDVTEGECSTR